MRNGPVVARRPFLQALAGSGIATTAGCLEVARSSHTRTETPTATPLEGTIQVAGSSTVYPLTLRIGELFASEHPAVSVSVTSTGTGGGFADFFCVGKTDLNNASREITATEREKCAANHVEFVQFQVATDALTVIVNDDADWISCITPEELALVWQTGGAQHWSDVRSEWPDEPIDLYGPTGDSGTFDYFAETILDSVSAHRRDYNGTEQDSSIIERVQESVGGIGYLGLAYYRQNSEEITAVAVDNGDGCIQPSLETAKSGAYSPLSRPLYLYVATEALSDDIVREFIRFYLDRVDTELVSDVGYVPLSGSTAQTNRAKLEDAVTETP